MSAASTEQLYPGSAGIHRLPAGEVGQRFMTAQIAALSRLEAALPALERAAELMAGALSAGGRAGYAGAGSSGLMALSDALELAGTFGIPPERTPVMFAGGAAALLHMQGGVEDDREAALEDFRASGLGKGDSLILVSASGRTPYALEIATAARAAGVRVTGIANVAGSPLLELAEVAVLLDTGPELIAGSTRLGAATAQKAALNLISVLCGIRLGHVHDGYMVNVVADNCKLAGRAAGIVAALAGSDEHTAHSALAQSDGAVKPAVLIALGQSPEEAQAALASTQGHLDPHLR